MTGDLNDTIVALSSAAPGPLATDAAGGFGRVVLRLSGPRALTVASRVFRPALAGTGPAGEGAGGVRWRRVAGEARGRAGASAACAYVMPGPRSYTRQDVVELHLPAATPLIAEALAELLRAGARAAQPGEFTRRAFLNGRLSLAQAEAIGALIRAETADRARAWAGRTVHRGASRLAEGRAELTELLSLLELGLDFSHEDVVLLPRGELVARLRWLRDRMAGAAGGGAGDERGSPAGWLPRVVLAGATNAGKSSLFNALLGRPAAIVSAREHTTRDAVEATFEPAPGVRVLLLDTAGAEPGAGPDADRRADDAPELTGAAELIRAAQDATRNALRAADVVLWVVETGRPAPARLSSGARAGDEAGRVAPRQAVVWSKCDLDAAAKPGGAAACGTDRATAIVAFRTSARTGEGLAELRRFVGEEAARLSAGVAAAQAAAGACEQDCAERSAAALARALAAAEGGLGEDAVAVEVREAVHALAEGEGFWLGHGALTEGLLDRVFAGFCLGK